MSIEQSAGAEKDRQERILDAVLALLVEQGIAGVSIRAVAQRAGVAFGLVNYYFDDKHHLICAALRRIEELDMALVRPVPGAAPEVQLLSSLRKVTTKVLLGTEYLSLRLQLWSLAQVHPDFAEINATAHKRYRGGLAALIRAASPQLALAECNRRAADIDLLQNGLWLSALLGLDRASMRRTVERCEQIALAP